MRNATLKLEDCSFAYPEAPVPALDGLNLTIKPGERIALIGRVASGKSTLGRLICGLYQPTDGAFLVNGIDSRQFRPQDLRSAFRFVGGACDSANRSAARTYGEPRFAAHSPLCSA